MSWNNYPYLYVPTSRTSTKNKSDGITDPKEKEILKLQRDLNVVNLRIIDMESDRQSNFWQLNTLRLKIRNMESELNTLRLKIRNMESDKVIWENNIKNEIWDEAHKWFQTEINLYVRKLEKEKLEKEKLEKEKLEKEKLEKEKLENIYDNDMLAENNNSNSYELNYSESWKAAKNWDE